MLRAIRIIGTALVIAFLARLSQEYSESRGDEPVPGYSIALGVVSLLFLVRAAAVEYAGRNWTVMQRDVLWGLSLGAFIAMLYRLLA